MLGWVGLRTNLDRVWSDDGNRNIMKNLIFVEVSFLLYYNFFTSLFSIIFGFLFTENNIGDLFILIVHLNGSEKF